MKIFSGDGKIKRSEAMNCLLVNQFATPGLGSIMARKFAAGIVQLILSVAGFVLIMGWFWQIMMTTYRMANEMPPEPSHYPWIGKMGAILFGVAWLLAWVTSLEVLRGAERNETPGPPKLPPRKPPRL